MDVKFIEDKFNHDLWMPQYLFKAQVNDSNSNVSLSVIMRIGWRTK